MSDTPTTSGATCPACDDGAKAVAAHLYSDRALADVAIVQAAMRQWRVQNDPADDSGSTMAEFVVKALYQEGRLR